MNSILNLQSDLVNFKFRFDNFRTEISEIQI